MAGRPSASIPGLGSLRTSNLPWIGAGAASFTVMLPAISIAAVLRRIDFMSWRGAMVVACLNLR